MVSQRAQFQQLGQYEGYYGFRNVDGAIDCTHIRIVNTPGVEHHEAFRNRKSYFSINVQAVVGPFGQFMDIVARWEVVHMIAEFFKCVPYGICRYIQQQHNGYLVGDSGYPCLRFLLTPISTPRRNAEIVYNTVHVKNIPSTKNIPRLNINPQISQFM